MVSRTKEKQISIRLSEEELEIMKANIENSGISQRDYIANCILNDSKNITLEKDIETANIKIKELEYLLENANNDLKKAVEDYTELEEKTLEIQEQAEEKALEIQEQAKEYKAKFEEKEESYNKLLDKAKNIKTKLKKETEEHKEETEYISEMFGRIIISTFISLLYAVVISVIAVIRHFELFAVVYIPVPIMFIWNIAVICGIIKYFRDN